jgi:hypothetical protein
MRKLAASALSPVLIAATLVLLPSLAASMGMPPPSDEDRQAIRQVLDSGMGEDAVTWQLIDMLLTDRYALARLAVDELKQRNLSEAHILQLENIVSSVPFRSPGSCVRSLVYPGSEVTGLWAWEVLVEHSLRGKSPDEQIEWLAAMLRYDRPFGLSRGDQAANRLQEIGEPAVPRLMRSLKRDNSNAQLWAA